jgi:hypothetical protein
MTGRGRAKPIHHALSHRILCLHAAHYKSRFHPNHPLLVAQPNIPPVPSRLFRESVIARSAIANIDMPLYDAYDDLKTGDSDFGPYMKKKVVNDYSTNPGGAVTTFSGIPYRCVHTVGVVVQPCSPLLPKSTGRRFALPSTQKSYIEFPVLSQ